MFELGLLGISAHVVDSLAQIGGQCATLYPEKPIYDIPAFAVVGAQELVDRLAEQIEPFNPTFHLGQEVVELQRLDNGAFRLVTATGTEFATRVVVIAGGLGSFQPRPLRVPGAKEHEGRNLEYKITDKQRYADKRVAILGGGDSALDWALELYDVAASVALVHRREEFRAQPASVAKMKGLANDTPERLRYVIGRVSGLIVSDGALAGLHVEPFGEDGVKEDVSFDDLLVFYGLSPTLGQSRSGGSRSIAATSTSIPSSSRPTSRGYTQSETSTPTRARRSSY